MKLIDKDTVVAEIERIRTLVGDDKFLSEYESGCRDNTLDICDDLLSFLDTLEVKDVNLKKEFDNYAKNILACDVQFEPFTHLYNCAKYFYELGINARKEDE